MNSSIIQYLFDANQINIKGAAAATRQPPSQTNISLNIWFIFDQKNIYGISMNYATIQFLFNENRPNIRGAAVF